jgi:predicted ATPase/DNA-binding CsgD family transcriptional regulator
MARTTPVVQGEVLIWPGDDQKQSLTVGSPAWYAWLEDASTFAFVGDTGTFTARKESTQHGGTYWKAYRKREGKLRRAYLGKSRDVSLARLQMAAAVLARQGSGQDAHRVDQAGGERPYHAPSADPAHDSIPQETPFARDQAVDLGRTAHRADSPAPRASALPTYLTPLLGREQEAQRVCSLLQRSEVRLLTLTGPAGVGKTRLGIQIASDLMHDFANGVCFVSLAPLSDPELVIPTIAQALDLPEAEDSGQGQAKPLQRLNTYLREKHVLLLLDNFEQVVAAAPSLVELLGACPGLKILVTSRVVLRVQGEYESVVPPLALPALSDPPDVEAVSRSAAVALFMQCAQATRPDFHITDANAPVIAEICVRLDGLPLAIELAAARIKLLPPEALLARLEHRLQILTSGARGLPVRQQTLRSTIKWSYELLPAGEQRLFWRLSVFVGGCTLKAVEAVCGEADTGALGALDGVASLLDNSLLQQTEQAGGEPRFVMLETIREYGRECLEASGEKEEIQRAHANYSVVLAEEAEPKLCSAERENWVHRLEREHDNIRAALSWSVERKEAVVALRLGGALWRFWLLQGHLSEGREWLEKALAIGVPQAGRLTGAESGALTPQVPSTVRAKALGGAGVLAHSQGDSRQAKGLCEESLALFRELEDKRGIAASLNGLGLIVGQATRARNDYAVARALYEESLAIVRELGDIWGIAETLWDFARVAFYQGDYTAGYPLCQESLAIFRELGDRRRIAEVLGSLAGYMAFYQGNYIDELISMEESLAIMRELGDRRSSAKLLWFLGHAAFVQEDYAKARTFYEEALAILQELGIQWFIASCLDGLAEVAVAQRQLEWAAHLLGAAALLREALGVSPPPYNLATYERAVATTRAQLGEERFAAAWAEGRKMTLEQVLAEQAGATTPGQTSTVPTIQQPASTSAPPPAYPNELTPREVEVLRLVASGLSNAQVGEKLIISPRTAHAHVRSIYSKLGITSRSAATRYAIDHKLL